MELNELLELLKGEKAILKSKVEAVLYGRIRGEARDLIPDIMKNFDDDLIEIIERVLKTGLAQGFINNKSRKFRIWRNRQLRKLRRFFG